MTEQLVCAVTLKGQLTLIIYAVYKYFLRNLFNDNILWVIREGRDKKKRIFFWN